MQFYVHDYLIDYLGGAASGPEVCCGLSVMYTANEYNPLEEELQQFSIYAGTPKGIGLYLNNYLDQMKDHGHERNISLFRPIIVTKEFNEKAMYQFIKKYIESLRGASEAELTLKIMLNFDWVHDNYTIDDEVAYLLNSKRK